MANETKDYRKDLFYSQKNGYDLIDTEERKASDAYCEDYKAFHNAFL